MLPSDHRGFYETDLYRLASAWERDGRAPEAFELREWLRPKPAVRVVAVRRKVNTDA